MTYERTEAVEWEEFEIEGLGGSPTRETPRTPQTPGQSAGKAPARRDSASEQQQRDKAALK